MLTVCTDGKNKYAIGKVRKIIWSPSILRTDIHAGKHTDGKDYLPSVKYIILLFAHAQPNIKHLLHNTQ